MSVFNKINKNNQAESLKRLRCDYITIFFELKQKYQCLTKQVLFLAIAIFDKYLSNSTNLDYLQAQRKNGKVVTIVACLTLAWKLEKNSITAHDVMEYTELSFFSTQELIDKEAQILETIDFELPIDHTYAAMVRDFYQKTMEENEEGMMFAVKCLKFYTEAIQMSSDFVLCSQLGPQIISCLETRRCSDHRLRQVCKEIQRKKEIQTHSSVSAS